MLEFRTYFQNKRNIVAFVVLIILLLAIPIGIYLARKTQIFTPRADTTGTIALAEGSCVTTLNGEKVLTCGNVPLRLTNPFEAAPSNSPAASIQFTPSANASTNSPHSSQAISPSPSAHASSTTVACMDNPPGTSAASGFVWKAMCGTSCTPNGQVNPHNPEVTLSDDCPSNGWCYQFSEGYRCLQFQSTH